MAMKTTLSLREYEDVLDPADIYSLLGMYDELLKVIDTFSGEVTLSKSFLAPF